MGAVTILGNRQQKNGYPNVKNELANCEELTESELVIRHGSLVRALARRFTSADFDDLFQVGRLALIESARTWSRQAQFWTYARRAVLGAMFDYATKEISSPRELETCDELASEDGSPEAALEAKELFSMLEGLELEIVTLRIRDGLGFLEISKQLGRSMSDVDRIYRGAIATLRERAGAS